jgi:hypothetical protein
MRRLLAASMLALIATLACGDPLFCPDGCSDGSLPQASTLSSAHGDCLACRNAMSTALPSCDLASDDVAELGGHDTSRLMPDSTSFSIDHPPRST